MDMRIQVFLQDIVYPQPIKGRHQHLRMRRLRRRLLLQNSPFQEQFYRGQALRMRRSKYIK